MLKKYTIITILLISVALWAGMKEDFYATGLSAKSLALGGTAFGFGVDSLYSNPAGLAVIPDQYATYSYKTSFDNMISTMTMQYMQPHERGAWGIGLIRMDNSGADKTTVDSFDRPDVQGTFGETQTGLVAAYALPVWGDSALGFGARYYHNRLDAETAQALGLYGGIIKKISYDWLIGCSISNISLSQRLTSTPIVWSTRQVDYFPLRISTSVAHRRYVFDYLTEVFVDQHFTQVTESGRMYGTYSLGSMVWIVPKVFCGRIGLHQELLSLGAGLRLSEWGVDYAYVNHQYLGGSHYITCSYKFGEEIQ